MKNWILFFALLFAVPAFSQSTVFAPKGAVWHQTPYSWQCFPAGGLFSYTADEDTILDGWNARIIHCNEVKIGGTTQIDSLTRYVSVQGDKVFWRVDDQFVVLFDFGATPGDTIKSAVSGFHVPSGCSGNLGGTLTFKYRIDSVGTTIIDGQNLRIQFVSGIYESLDLNWSIGLNANAIVERVGIMNSTYWYGSGEAFILAGCPSFIRCYADNDIYYQNPAWLNTGKTCDFTLKTAEPQLDLPKISPNPACDFVELPFEPDEISLSNPLGQAADISVFDKKLDVSQLQPGLWFLSLKKGENWIGFRLIVQ